MNAASKNIAWAFASFAAGYLYWQLLALFWTFWAPLNPLASALLSPGNVYPEYRWFLYPTDFATSVLVSLPFAFLLLGAARSRLWLCTVAASLACLVNVDWPGVLSAPATVAPAIIRGFAIELIILPASVALALALRRCAPNNSSKPTPLRGAA